MGPDAGALRLMGFSVMGPDAGALRLMGFSAVWRQPTGHNKQSVGEFTDALFV